MGSVTTLPSSPLEKSGHSPKTGIDSGMSRKTSLLLARVAFLDVNNKHILSVKAEALKAASTRIQRHHSHRGGAG